MNERYCIRCHQPVTLDDGHLVYCVHCGAPQIFLSEELQAELAESVRTYNERNSPQVPQEAAAAPPDLNASGRWKLLHPRLTDSRGTVAPWTVAVHYALLSGCLALALGLLSLLLPPVSLLLAMWIFGAPVASVALFSGQNKTSGVIGGGFGARLGLLTGILVACGCAIVFTLSLVLSRFVLHDAGTLDAQLAVSFAQQRHLVIERLGAGVRPTLDLFNAPDYRVGLLLAVAGMSASIYLGLSILAGGVAGLALHRRQG